MPVEFPKFVECLTSAGLVSAADIDAAKTAGATDAQTLASALVRAGKITRYQAQVIYQYGRTDGLLFGEYVVLDKIGAGGMGQVFRAEHRRMKRVVAIKVLPPSATRSAHAVERFHREVETAARVMHPNIVRAFDAGETRGVHYLVMEYVEGEDLSNLIKRDGPVDMAKAVNYMLQAARGLAAAHELGIIHRDIKPANLLLDRAGNVKILDMGLARIDDGDANAAAAEGLTQAGEVMGTADYMAPEQAQDTRKADARSDIYSLGCAFYRLLTGRVPYGGDTLVKKLLAHREQPIPALRNDCPNVPDRVQRAFEGMMAKNPADRFQTAAALAQELEACAAELAGDAPPASSVSTKTTSPGAAAAAKPAAGKPLPKGKALGSGTVLKKGTPLPVVAAKKKPVVLWAGLGGLGVAAAIVVAVMLSRGGDDVELDPAVADAEPVANPSTPAVPAEDQTNQPAALSSAPQPAAGNVFSPPSASTTPQPKTTPSNGFGTGQTSPPSAAPPMSLQPNAVASASPSSMNTPGSLSPSPSANAFGSAATPAQPAVPANTATATSATNSQLPANAKRGRRTDLFSRLNTQGDAVQGNWLIYDGALIFPSVHPARLMLPGKAPQEYDLELTVQGSAASRQFMIGLVYGGRQCLIVLDGGSDGRTGGVHQIDLKPSNANETTFMRRVLKDNEPNVVLYCVRKDGIRVFCNNEPVLQYLGSPDRLDIIAEWRIPDQDRLFLAGSRQSDHRVTGIVLYEPNAASLASIAPPPPSPSADGSAPMTPAPETTAGGPTKLKVPETAALAEARKQFQAAFRAEITAATTPDAKAELSRTLASRLSDVADDPAGQYVMLEEANKLAAASGQLRGAIDALRQFSDTFEVDQRDLAKDTLAAVLRLPRQAAERRALALEAAALADQLAADGQWDLALDVHQVGFTTAQRLNDALLAKDLREAGDKIRAAKQQWDVFVTAKTALEKDPADAAARLAVGRYLCFVRDDWDTGLPQLAAGSDEKLATIAKQDLGQPSTNDERLALGDAWWDAAPQASGGERVYYIRRARDWYAKSLPSLAGLQQVKVQQRFDEASKLLAAASGKDAKRHPLDSASFGGHWYKLFDEQLTWSQAKERCEELGGYLVCLETPQENQFVLQLTTEYFENASMMKFAWIGGTDEGTEGVFRWLTGAPVAYGYWHQGEPNNLARDGENAMSLWCGPSKANGGVRWNDNNGNAFRAGYVCEWER